MPISFVSRSEKLQIAAMVKRLTHPQLPLREILLDCRLVVR